MTERRYTQHDDQFDAETYIHTQVQDNYIECRLPKDGLSMHYQKCDT